MLFPVNLFVALMFTAVVVVTAMDKLDKLELETNSKFRPVGAPEPSALPATLDDHPQAGSDAEEMAALLRSCQPPLAPATMAAAQRKFEKSNLQFAQLVRVATTLPSDMAAAGITGVAREMGLASLGDRLAFFEAVVRRGGQMVEGAPYAL
jgi:hypothetical protein